MSSELHARHWIDGDRPRLQARAMEKQSSGEFPPAANFSTSGENAQDNDLIVIRDLAAAAKFDAPL
jgi:hypothetical protein